MLFTVEMGMDRLLEADMIFALQTVVIQTVRVSVLILTVSRIKTIPKAHMIAICWQDLQAAK